MGTMSEDFSEEIITTESEVTVRRAPRYGRFMLAGAIFFAIVALILTFTFPAQATYSTGQVFGFLLVAALVVGVAVGAVVAIVVDRITGRRARTVLADRLDVRSTRDENAEVGDTSDTNNPTNS
jgi:hypothetical protein